MFCICVGVFSKRFEVFSTEKVDGTGFLINAVQQVGEYFGINWPVVLFFFFFLFSLFLFGVHMKT